jgi:translation initiation factor IF-3
LINGEIKSAEVRLISEKGEQLGVLSVEEALRRAQEDNLDLVEIVPNATPPVAKIMDYNKYRYDAEQKIRQNKRRQVNVEIKEVRFRLKIDENDFSIKANRAMKFLKTGNKVKATLMFRGREMTRPDAGIALLQRLADMLEEVGMVETPPAREGRNMTMVLRPTGKRQVVESEQRRRGRKTAEDRKARQLARLEAKKKKLEQEEAQENNEVA